MIAPPKIWWKPLGRYERRWLLIAFVWCLFLTAMMPLWFYLGRQNVPVTTYRVTPQEFNARVMEFTEQYQVDTLNGIPAGGDAYIQARQWQWYPVLKLKKGETYKLHLSSLDVQHGFSIQPLNMNFMVLPGYDYVLTLTPTTSGEYSIVCNEFCGIGHHVMIGKILVSE